eukprot:UN00910
MSAAVTTSFIYFVLWIYFVMVMELFSNILYLLPVFFNVADIVYKICISAGGLYSFCCHHGYHISFNFVSSWMSFLYRSAKRFSFFFCLRIII